MRKYGIAAKKIEVVYNGYSSPEWKRAEEAAGVPEENKIMTLSYLGNIDFKKGGRLIRYFGIAAEGRLDVGLLFAIIGYNLPTFLELILPLSFFVALMLVLGRMYVDHEMSVLFSSGNSLS